MKILESSFRDPSGFVFREGEQVYRQINKAYSGNYELLMHSGLYQSLIDSNRLIPHVEVNSQVFLNDTSWKVIRPDNIPFISYPYEWSFTQLKDAALLTLEIQKESLKYGMSLKDANSYNIQFFRGKPIFIDTLSFEEYEEGTPWVAYRQFIQHFYAPLLLMCFVDIRFNQWFKIHIDGIPIDLASTLLPKKTYLNFSVLTHIHLHARSQRYYGNKKVKINENQKFSRQSFLALLDNLESSIKKLIWKAEGTEWGNYYDDTNYSKIAAKCKEEIIDSYLENIPPLSLWDIGANTGYYSRIASTNGINTISFDIDPAAVEKNYILVKKQHENKILPLLLDISNPSPGIGWANMERSIIEERGKPDRIMALALVHHLSIGGNVPFERIASYFSQLSDSLIIEFVPKSDSQVQRLLTNREDVFINYTQEYFEEVFTKYFQLICSNKINDSERVMYLFIK